jgi:hypothetical protein
MSDAPTTMRAQSSNLENACKPESAIASEFRKPFPASFVSKNRPMLQITFAVPARRTGNIGIGPNRASGIRKTSASESICSLGRTISMRASPLRS